MKRRMLCFLLSVVMLVGLIPVVAQAEETMTISDTAVEVLKKFEGFSPTAYQDYGQYSIGYGTSCSEADFRNGLTITEEEASRRLLARIDISAKELMKFAAEHNLTFNQGQFDALLLFTYNVGEGWMQDTSARFRKSVIDGDTGNKFVYNMALWSTAGGAPHAGLLNRRLCEADMYLNGNYSNSAPANYNFVIFNAQGGQVDDRMQGYISNESVQIKSIPQERTGYRFLGWNTKASGGQWVTGLTENHDGMTLHAHWQQGEGTLDGKGNIMGTAAEYSVVASNLVKLDKYEEPDAASDVAGTLTATDTVSIVADYMDDSDVKWGKLSTGEWVILGGVNPEDVITSHPAFEVTVTNTYINVRKNAGAGYELVGQVMQGDKLTITRTKTVNGELWGKFSDGWVSLKYTDYVIVAENNSNSNAPVIATGYVVCNNYLNVRQNAGTHYQLVGKLLPGDEVKISEFKMVGVVQWARVQQGWVSMDYIQLDKAEEEPDDSEDSTTGDDTTDGDDTTTGDNTGNNDSSTGDDTTGDDTINKDETTKPDDSDEEVLYKGTVVNADTLRVRSAPGTANPQVGYLTRGQKVSILEEKKVADAPWGRIEEGWICLLYVQPEPTEEELKNAAAGVVISFSPLNIRSAPGAHNTLMGTLVPGTVVTVYQQSILNGVAWGRIAQGWVCMTYVQIDEDLEIEDPTDPDVPSDSEDAEESEVICNGSVIMTNELRIRTGAGTHHAEVGRLTLGSKVKIYEIVQVNSMKWGRTEKGWVSLNYIKIEPVEGVQSEPLPGTVTVLNTPLKVRSGAGVQHKLVDQLKNGTKVTVYEIKMVNTVAWGRIDKGWVCLDYVTLQMPTPEATPVDPSEPSEDEDEDTTESTESTDSTDSTDSTESTEESEDATTAPSKDTVLYTGKIILTNALRIRKEAGTTYPQVGTLSLNAKVSLYEVVKINGMKWGRIDKGWICLNYVELEATKENAEHTMLGTVSVVNTPLKIRSGVGVQNKQVGELKNGAKITIYEIKLLNTVAWGRIDGGWVCLDYVTLEAPDPSEITEDPGEDETEDPTDEPEDSTESTESTEDPDDSSEPEYTTVLYTGKVALTNSLTIRKQANANSTSVGKLTLGTKVEIYDVKVVNGMKWGRVSKGWISMNYVEIDLTEENISNTVLGIVTSGTTPLKVRSGPGVTYQIVTQLNNGTEVMIYDLTYTNNVAWGRVSKGWICLDYVSLTVPNPDDIQDKPSGGNVQPENPSGSNEQDKELTDPDTPKNEVKDLVITVTAETIGQITTDYPNLESVYFKDSTCYDAIVAFATENPDIKVTYTVDIFGSKIHSTATTISLSHIKANQVEQAAALVKLLPKVTEIKLINASGKSNLTVADVKEFIKLAPGYKYQYKFSFYGTTVDINAKEIVLKDVYIGNKGEQNLRNVLDIMQGCTYMNLGDPGIDYEIMADIRNDYRSKTKVAWLVYYGAYKGGAPRSAMSDTDTLHHVYYLTDKNCDNLKYFEDVKYIDFGHNTTLSRIDYIKYMPKLEMIILSGSAIKNLDAFANHQNIQFIEAAWCTNVTDISGVKNCPNLKYLNISHTKTKDVSVVHGLPLELFMCIKAGVDNTEKAAIQKAIPGCWITNTGNDGAEYSYGWRYEKDGTRTEPYDKLWVIFNYGAYWEKN